MLYQTIAEVQLYHEQARLVVAGRLLAVVDQYLASGQHTGRAEVKEALALLGGELKASFDQLRRRAAECSSTLEDWHSVSAREALLPHFPTRRCSFQAILLEMKQKVHEKESTCVWHTGNRHRLKLRR